MTIHPAVIDQIKKRKVRQIKRKYLDLPFINDNPPRYDYNIEKKKSDRGVIIIDPSNCDDDPFKKFTIY